MSEVAPIRDNPRRAFSIPMTPDQYCEDRAAAFQPITASAFWSLSAVAPSQHSTRSAEVSNIADDVADRNAASKLGWWRAEIANLFAGHHAQSQCRRCNPRLPPMALMRAALERNHRRHGWISHHRYSDFGVVENSIAIASPRVVGQLSAGIFGFRSPSALEYADNLGLAFSSPISSVMWGDARRGRIYLPAEDLRRFGVEETALMQGRYSAAFEQMMQFQAERARAHYAKAMGRAGYSGPQGSAAGPHDVGHLFGVARRNRTREIPRIASADFAPATSKAVKRLKTWVGA